MSAKKLEHAGLGMSFVPYCTSQGVGPVCFGNSGGKGAGHFTLGANGRRLNERLQGDGPPPTPFPTQVAPLTTPAGGGNIETSTPFTLAPVGPNVRTAQDGDQPSELSGVPPFSLAEEEEADEGVGTAEEHPEDHEPHVPVLRPVQEHLLIRSDRGG